MQSSKILLFGGTFDPFHNGHYEILKQAQKLINPTKTIVLVNNVSPLKMQNRPVSSDHRLIMTKIALANESDLEVSDFELKSNEPSYSINTIKHFVKLYPNTEFYWLMGADQYKNLHLWHQYEDILKLVKIVVANRDNNEALNANINCDPIIISGLKFPISSSQIRKQPLPYLLDEKVLNYINDYGLYAIDRIKPLMSEHRFQHSLRVAYMASDLMSHYNRELIHLAYTCGIYHDISKEMDYSKQEEIAKNILGINQYEHVKVLHGYIGAYELRQKYWFNNQNILNAIARHTKPFDFFHDEPTLLDKVLYLADKLEANRTDNDVFGKDINYYRKLAYKDINLCFIELYNWLQFNLSKK